MQASCHGTDVRAMLDAIAASGGRYIAESAMAPEEAVRRKLLVDNPARLYDFDA